MHTKKRKIGCKEAWVGTWVELLGHRAPFRQNIGASGKGKASGSGTSDISIAGD